MSLFLFANTVRTSHTIAAFESVMLIAAALILLALGLRFYSRIAMRITAGSGLVETALFERGDLILTLMLGSWFATNAVAGFFQGSREINGKLLITGALMFLMLAGLIGGFLAVRGKLGVMGLDRMRFRGALWKAFGALACAYPLVGLAALATQSLLGAEVEGQEIVKFFLQNDSETGRLGVILMAVAAAPLCEELIFRGYFYPTLKKFIGLWPSLLVTSALFAVIHVHLPSTGPLFLLAVCLCLAYEATGSLLVPMIMHATFNAVSLAFLLCYPGANP